jgi:micrococcal nuclease
VRPRGAFPAGILLLAVTSCAVRAAPAETEARVVRVIDGDTIEVERDGEREKCRLLGIDTPEMSYGRLLADLERAAGHEPPGDRREFAEAIGVVRRHAERLEERARAARDALAWMIDGRVVTLVRDSGQPERDRYGRLLAFIELDGLDIGAELVRRGLATVDERFECDRLKDYRRLRRSVTGSPETEASGRR